MSLEALTQTFVEGDDRISVTVWREVAEDDLGIQSINDEQFGDWLEANLDRVLRSALHKRRNFTHVLVSGSIHIKPGELVA